MILHPKIRGTGELSISGITPEFNFPVLYIVWEDKSHEIVGATLYPKVNENIHVAIVPFAGHLVHTDQPEIYTRILEEFIKRSY